MWRHVPLGSVIEMTLIRCQCPCHGEEFYGVLVTDPIEAVTACKHCVDDHVPALTFKPPTDWKPDADSTGDEGKETL